MLDNPLLTVCIGLAFFYLLLSIVVTTLHELLAGLINFRGRNLMLAIEELIAQPEMRATFFSHPMISPLFQHSLVPKVPGVVADRPRVPPPYIPARNFAVAVREITRKVPDESDFATAAKLGAAVALVATRAATLRAAEPASAEDPLIKELERLYDTTMDRATGWYKRWAQRGSFFLGLGLAILLNADSIHIAQRLWSDPMLAAATSRAAEQFVRENPTAAGATGPAPDGASSQGAPSQGAPSEGASSGGAPSQAASTPSAPVAGLARFVGDLARLDALNLPIGWDSPHARPGGAGSGAAVSGGASSGSASSGPAPSGSAGARPAAAESRWFPSFALFPEQTWFTFCLGVLITALAIGLGSAFWFDLLGRFVNLRSSGPREVPGAETAPRGS